MAPLCGGCLVPSSTSSPQAWRSRCFWCLQSESPLLHTQIALTRRRHVCPLRHFDRCAQKAECRWSCYPSQLAGRHDRALRIMGRVIVVCSVISSFRKQINRKMIVTHAATFPQLIWCLDVLVTNAGRSVHKTTDTERAATPATPTGVSRCCTQRLPTPRSTCLFAAPGMFRSATTGASTASASMDHLGSILVAMPWKAARDHL